VTGVASLVLLADIGDQRLGPLELYFECGDKRVFCINDDMSRFPLNFKADRKLHLCSPRYVFEKIAQFILDVRNKVGGMMEPSR